MSEIDMQVNLPIDASAKKDLIVSRIKKDHFDSQKELQILMIETTREIEKISRRYYSSDPRINKIMNRTVLELLILKCNSLIKRRR